jgi:PAS domain S-box-containing protein
MIHEKKFNSLGLFVLDHVSAMLAYWDKDLVCRFANTAYMDWFGKSRAEMVDKITIKELLGPLYEKNLPYISKALKGEIQTFERAIPLPSGELRYSIANYFPDIVNGNVRGFVAHIADITQIKLLEKELVKSNEMISEQNKLLMNFANIVSHNLGNYASGFSGLLDLLVEADSTTQGEIIGYLRSYSNNFTMTIDNLTEIIHVKNNGNIELMGINLYEYITKVISTISTEVNDSNAIIKNNLDNNTIILGNPAYIESILMNFFTNAIKYKHPDRIPIIEINCAVRSDEIVLTIADNGRGINLEKYGKDIFGMYKTFHGNTDARGIGLYITRYQIEAMGGHVQVESEENKGSKFIVHLKQK